LIRQESTLQEVVAPAIERMRVLSRDKNIEFVEAVTSDDVRLSVDRSRITQVLDNLLGNALKFTPTGGTITIKAMPGRQQAQLDVADTGPGIPNEILGRIFEPYWQAQRTRTGMGLGLFIAKMIIEGHGGSIRVESTVGRGTTFYITLPSI
jgi:signal transduction histidine kinase